MGELFSETQRSYHRWRGGRDFRCQVDGSVCSGGSLSQGVAGGKELSEGEGSNHRRRGTIPVGVIIACGQGLSNYRYRQAVTGGQEHRWRGATAGGMERLQEERSDHMWRETITGWEEISQVNCSDRRYGGT